MDSGRQKVSFKWLHTAFTSPTQPQRKQADSSAPSCQNKNEDSSNLPLSESPGSEKLGTLSLNTPKRKAKVLCESLSSLGKIKLRKLSRKNSETFKTLKVRLYYLDVPIS